MASKKETLLRAIRKIRQAGNSEVVTLPPEILNHAGLKAGQSIMIKGKKKTIELSWFD